MKRHRVAVASLALLGIILDETTARADDQPARAADQRPVWYREQANAVSFDAARIAQRLSGYADAAPSHFTVDITEPGADVWMLRLDGMLSVADNRSSPGNFTLLNAVRSPNSVATLSPLPLTTSARLFSLDVDAAGREDLVIIDPGSSPQRLAVLFGLSDPVTGQWVEDEESRDEVLLYGADDVLDAAALYLLTPGLKPSLEVCCVATDPFCDLAACQARAAAYVQDAFTRAFTCVTLPNPLRWPRADIAVVSAKGMALFSDDPCTSVADYRMTADLRHNVVGGAYTALRAFVVPSPQAGSGAYLGADPDLHGRGSSGVS